LVKPVLCVAGTQTFAVLFTLRPASPKRPEAYINGTKG
jgi:hypothetical protein